MTDHRRDLDVHLATCPECAADVARYRELHHAVASLRDELEPVPEGLSASILARVGSGGLLDRALGAVHDRRVHVAAASIGGAVLGAGAMALIVWRASRRGVPRAA